MSIIAAFAVPHPPIILPEIGKGEEKKLAATTSALEELNSILEKLLPQTVVIISPHSVSYADYIHISPGSSASGSFSSFGAQQRKLAVNYDEPFVQQLARIAAKNGVPAGTLGEKNAQLDHGTMLPLCYFPSISQKCRVVRIGISSLSPAVHYALGRCIAKTAEMLDRKTLIIASGDLSHKLKPDGPYGFAPEGPEFDARLIKTFETGDFLQLMQLPADLCEGAAECGRRGFIVMAGAFDGLAVESKLLSYEGPFGVGYAAASFLPKEPDDSRHFGALYEQGVQRASASAMASQDEYAALARKSLETFVKTGETLALPDGLSKELMERRAGVFVSLKKEGELRGCIGTIAPVTSCVAEEIIRNAIIACSEDPRFEPVREEELGSLVYSVDVLGEPERTTKAGLDPRKYGVIVTQGRRRGLLLPSLPGIDDVDEQIAIASRKAGIISGANVELQRFIVVRHR